jgi:hypothetical protein
MIFSHGIVSSMLYDETYRICGDGEYFHRAVALGAKVVTFQMPISRFYFGGLSLTYPGLLKQREVYRFSRKAVGNSVLISLVTAFLSWLTTSFQRFTYRQACIGRPSDDST